MLDSVTAPAVPLGAQWLGLARDLRRRVAAEDAQYDAAIQELIAPIRDRLRRFPHRSLRPEMLVDLVQGWRFLPYRDWRLSCDAKLDRHRAELVEHRVVAGASRRLDDPAWTGREDDLAVIRVELMVNRSDARLASRCVVTLSLHALARRLQRHPDGSAEALLADIALAADAASGTLTPGAGYKVPTPGGGWRGRAALHKLPGGDSFPVLALRTWLND